MNLLGIFAKHPVPGRVKTRLAAGVGARRAAELSAAFIEDLADRFRRTAERRVLCYSPEEDAAADYFSGVAQGDYRLWPQGGGSLGARMRAFFDRAFQSGAGRIVLIGSDSPTLPADRIERAFELLHSCDCVLGPATDGGYYLIGQRGSSRPIFEDVQWSDPRTFEQTVARIAQLGDRLELLPPWYDVDTPQDLALLRGHMRALRISGSAVRLPRTRACEELR